MQIEGIVERARSRLDAVNRAKLTMHVGQLAAADIRRMGEQTRHDILAADEVDQVTRKMVREFCDLLKERPRNMPKAVAELPLKDQVAWGKAQENCRVITKQTVNAKGRGAPGLRGREVAGAGRDLDRNGRVDGLEPGLLRQRNRADGEWPKLGLQFAPIGAQA